MRERSKSQLLVKGVEVNKLRVRPAGSNQQFKTKPKGFNADKDSTPSERDAELYIL